MPVFAPRPPKRATIWPNTDRVVAGNGIVGSGPDGTTYCRFSYWTQSAPAINDERSNSFFLRAGTYTFRLRGLTTSTAGIATIYIDGVSQGTIDMYAAAAASGAGTLAITVTTDGYHTLNIKMASKNASSSNYNCFAECYDIYPAAE